MLVSFDDMSPQSRVWVYQCNRQLNHDEQLRITEMARPFMDQWAAHNQALKCSFSLFYDYFLIISVDESYNQASGCSIDSSVHLLKQIEHQFQVDFFDRTKVAFLNNGKVFLESISNLKTRIIEGSVTDHTITFNNLVKDKEDLAKKWKVPASESWIKRYFPQVKQH
ncbi:MAG: hypothetical protein AAGF85_19370 [Bacteroidota bacterium]